MTTPAVSLRWAFVLTLALPAVTACTAEPAGPAVEERSEGALAILRLSADAPPLANAELSFWARWGQNHTERISFQGAQGQEGDRFVELNLAAAALLAYPDGRPFLPGDSVLITMRVVDPARILIQLQPAGLRFNPLAPAELIISYRHADPDLNRDGQVDDADRQLELQLAIWRQAVVGGTFLRLVTIRFGEAQELRAALLAFSRFAVAY